MWTLKEGKHLRANSKDASPTKAHADANANADENAADARRGTTTTEETVSVTASKTLSSLSKSQGARSR